MFWSLLLPFFILFAQTVLCDKRHSTGNSPNHAVQSVIARIEDYPFIVRLNINYKPTITLECGGTYIGNLWVLTAAYCLDVNYAAIRFPPSVGKRQDRIILAMEEDFTVAKKYQFSISARLYIHPKYWRNVSCFTHNIGLVKTQYHFNLTDRSQMASLPKNRVDYSGKLVTLIGWGLTKKTHLTAFSIRPMSLQKLVATVYTMSECNRTSISESAICIGATGLIPCSGDLGGPLVRDKLVIGVFSYGFGCAGEYAVYEDVYSHKKWINKLMDGGCRSLHGNPRNLIVFFLMAVNSFAVR